MFILFSFREFDATWNSIRYARLHFTGGNLFRNIKLMWELDDPFVSEKKIC